MGELRDGAWTLEEATPRLDAALRKVLPGVSWGALRKAIGSGKVKVDGEVVREPSLAVAAGANVVLAMRTPRQRDTLPEGAIVHVDTQIVVVLKPAGMLSVPDDERTRGSLVQRLSKKLRKRSRGAVPLGIVQRLDRDTSGVLVFTRTPEARAHLKEQFGRRDVDRRYWAIAAGHVKGGRLQHKLIETKRGKRHASGGGDGKTAVTHVEVLERLRGASFIKCRLETGRTHQIRLQLSEAGHPLLGETRYTRADLDPPRAPRLMLHAAELGFEHPTTGAPMRFEAPLPDDMRACLETLGSKQAGDA